MVWSASERGRDGLLEIRRKITRIGEMTMQPRFWKQTVAVISLFLTSMASWNCSQENRSQLADSDCSDEKAREVFEKGTAAAVTACLQAGADLKARDMFGYTPLHIAAEHNKNPDVIAVLVDAGADLEARDKIEDTPLHRAAGFNQSTAIITALVDAGADLEARGLFGNTPLHVAAMNSKNPDVIAVLLDAGADLEARDPYGVTALHFAAIDCENPDVITALIDAGADLTARDNPGKTPWDYAKVREEIRESEAYRRLKESRN